MTDDRTPLQRLDDAVHDFAAATGCEGTVGSWVLAYETSRVQAADDSALPLVYGSNYSIGPATSPATAVGLGRYVAAVVEQHLLDSTALDEEDDDQ